MLIIFSLIIILFSAIIHEYMHAWMADYLGDKTARHEGRLTLNPISHIDLWGSILMPLLLYIGTGGLLFFGYAKPVPFNPYNLRDQKYGIAKVAVAGPLANLITAIFFGLVLRFLGVGNMNFAIFLIMIIQVNIVLMIFNLIPIPPLDGSKVLMTFLPYNYQQKLASLEQYGFIFVLIFVMFGFDLVIPIINFFVKLIVGYSIL